MTNFFRICPALLFLAAIFYDNFFYVAAGIAIAVTALLAKFGGGYFFAAASLFWSLGVAFVDHPLLSNIGYLLFYPLLFIAIPKLFQINRESSYVNLIDAAILVLGISTLGAGLLIKNNGNIYQVLYLIADLIVLIWTFVCALRRPLTINSFLILLGITIFTSTDFLFLYNSQSYQFGSWLDFGWLLGFLFLGEAQFHRGISSEPFEAIHPIYIGISLILAVTVLSIIIIYPGRISQYLFIPSVLTLLLSFTRMTFALKKSETLAAEQQLARIDDLTGLPNRRKFLAELANSSSGAILLLDIDGFKPVNDQFGHETGDHLLQQIAARFIKALPEDALIARLGGDEFGVITNGSYESAVELAMALRATLSYPFAISGEQIHVGVSVGCVANDGGDDLMRRADTAMYQAKRAGIGVWADRN